eukprot:CAMPEP_0172689268 /NCGR_PEP_ID=MMETSP1074-20121228/23025_1 /TAXON_ID=2916 /ORGANISM="Ceratium fusus, Strain PA161109" /LENGTH=31 /DNA_ID= /DNA_START= /DNA_END= /DNA_ORIENTATION=
MPEANAKAADACSSMATCFSKAVRVGFPERV